MSVLISRPLNSGSLKLRMCQSIFYFQGIGIDDRTVDHTRHRTLDLYLCHLAIYQSLGSEVPIMIDNVCVVSVYCPCGVRVLSVCCPCAVSMYCVQVYVHVASTNMHVF